MEAVYLPEQDMHPRIRMARLYDTEQFGITGATPVRVVNCFELSTFLCDGGVLYINGQAQRIHSGDVRFSLPGDRLSSSPPFRCCTIFFQLGPEELRYKNELISAIPGYFPGGGIQTPLFRQIIEQFSSERTGSRAAQNALLLQLLLGLYALFRPESGRSGPVNRCMEYMQNHTGERVTLDRLGELTGYSPLHVLRLFKAAVGCSPHEYLSSLRMERAKQLLIESDMPIDRVAAECGFSSESYFHSYFKHSAGISPGEYRRIAKIL